MLSEIRGDWACYKEVFRLPGWNSNAGICFKCYATKWDIVAENWQSISRKSHWDLLGELREHSSGVTWLGLATRQILAFFVVPLSTMYICISVSPNFLSKVNPIFSCPGVTADTFVVDWLHCSDLGVAQDFLGNLFHMVLPKLEGNNLKARCSSLYTEILSWCKANGVSDRLDDLTPGMVKKEGSKPPKLRSYAAECKALVPFGVDLANRYLDDGNTVEHTAKQAAQRLNACYSCLSAETYNPHDMATNCTEFCSLHKALSDTSDGVAWRMKPKLHMFQECCYSKTRPSTCWTYRDEDFGGYAAKTSRRRGGKSTVASTSSNVLDKLWPSTNFLQ